LLDLDLSLRELLAQRWQRQRTCVYAWDREDRCRELIARDENHVQARLVSSENLPRQVELLECPTLLRRQHVEPQLHAAQRIRRRECEVTEGLEASDPLREEIAPVARLAQAILVLERRVNHRIRIDRVTLQPRTQRVGRLVQ